MIKTSFWWYARVTQLLLRFQKAGIHVALMFLALSTKTVALMKRLDPLVDRRCAKLEEFEHKQENLPS